MPQLQDLKYDVIDLTYDGVKPGIPVLLPVALALWAVCAIAYAGLRVVDIEAVALLGVIGAATCIALVAVVVMLKRGFRIVLIAVSVLLGISLASYGAFQIKFAEQNFIGLSQMWEFALSEDAKPGMYGSSCSASATGENGMRTQVRINFSGECDLKQGALLSAKASLTPPKEDSAEYFWSRGLCGSVNLSVYEMQPEAPPASWIHQIRNTAISRFEDYGGSQAGLLQALVCGYRNTIQESGDYENYKVVGLAHLVAVSGAHLAIVAMLLGWFLRKLCVPHWLHVAATVAFVLAYLLFTGVPISAVRAAFMVVLSTTAVFARRRAASLNSLALCIVVFLALDPSTAVSVSFFLSAGSTLGIVLFAGLIASWFKGLSDKVRKLVAEPLGLTLASNMVTLPFSAALFSQVPLLAPLANIVATPLFSVACISGLLSACIAVAIPAVAGAAIGVAAACVTPLSSVVSVMAQIPYACVAVQFPVVAMVIVSVIACLILWIAWPKLKLKTLAKIAGVLCAVVAAFLFLLPRLAGDELIMLDVGQGDAILVRSGGSAVLVDTGNQETKLKENLGALGVYTLDAVIISHHDDDHIGCLESLAEYENVGAVYCAEDALTCACKNCGTLRNASASVCPRGLQGLSVGDSIRVGTFTLSVIGPKEYTDEGGNADSVCLLLKADCDSDGETDWQALLTGDAESEELEKLVSTKSVGDIDVLKVGHHGSRVTLTDKLAKQLSPEIALISVGAKNRYGHPTQEALDILENANAQVYRTDLSGTIRLSFTSDRISVESEKEGNC